MTRHDTSQRRGGQRLSLRLFWAMVLVILAGAGTLLTVSLLLAPAIFTRHLEAAGEIADPDVIDHVHQGFATATITATGVGIIAALAVAAAGALLIARRIADPIAATAQVTARLAAGDYTARAHTAPLGPELAQLTDSVNTLATRLADAEAVRTRMLADLAHELRTPLAALDATIEAITDGVLPADATTLATVTTQSNRLAQLVDDLTLVSRAEERAFTNQPTQTDLATLAADSQAAAAARYQAAGVNLHLTGETNTPVDVDPARIREVIDQLLANALAACRPGDIVTVAVHNTPTPELTVTDTGHGFNPDQAQHLFERFYRADPARTTPGSGIGLTIARAITQANNATLTATSPGPGQGATFTMTFH